MGSQIITKFEVYHKPSSIPGKKGPAMAFVSDVLDFSVANPYLLDLSSLNQQDVFLEVQTIELDNTNNPNQVTLVYSREIQLTRIFPASVIQAYTVPGVVNPRYISVSNAQNSGTAKIYLYGYPVPDSASINISGSSSTLDEIASNTADTVSNLPNGANQDGNDPADLLLTFANPILWTGSSFERKRVNRTPFNGSGITATTGSLLAVGNRLFDFEAWLSGDASIAAAGDNLITLYDGSVVVAVGKPYIPASGLNTLTDRPVMRFSCQDGYVVQTGLTISLASALASGNLYFNGSAGPA